VILAAAFCPHPPVLVPDVVGAAAPELEDLRSAALAAITAAHDSSTALVLIGSGPVSLAHSPLARGSFAGYGVPGDVHLGNPSCGGAQELPLSLTVGAWLVREALDPRTNARGFSVGPDFAGSHAAVELLALAQETDLALIVLGDGSARRSPQAPGYLDDRAAGFDAAVAAALGSGDPDSLARIDADLGQELLAAGVPAWHAAADVLTGRYAAQVTYDDAPYGVGYFVAQWARD
jgi:hypothetical protein